VERQPLFVLMNCEGHDCGLDGLNTCQNERMTFTAPDRWIVSELQKTEAAVAQGFAEYRLDNVATALYEFVWNAFCDWYLEIAKVQLQTVGEAAQRGTRRTLIRTLEAILRLAHPVIPFVTEALWQVVAPVAGRAGPFIMIAPYPEAQPERIDEAATTHVRHLQQMVDACRQLRGEMGVSPAQRLPLLAVADDAAEAAFLRENAAVLHNLAKLSDVQVFDAEAPWQEAAGHAPVLGVGKARLALHVQIDPAVEQARLSKEAARLSGEIAKATAKLANQAFVAKAPPAVIAQEQQRMADFSATLGRIPAQLARLA